MNNNLIQKIGAKSVILVGLYIGNIAKDCHLNQTLEINRIYGMMAVSIFMVTYGVYFFLKKGKVNPKI